MNAERLLQHYEQIADAPDAIARLRRFILDLAVRGKLVPKDPADEPASELLKRIDAEKKRLVNAKAIRGNKAKTPPPDAKLPCDLPKSGWIWVSLSHVGRISGGMTPSMAKPDYWGGTVSWLSPKDIKSEQVFESELKITELGLSETRLEAYPVGSLFIVARSGILKRTLPVAINQKPAAANQDMKVLVPFLPGMERYLQIMLRGFEGFILSELVKTGTTVQSLKYDAFEAQLFPLPPLAEQHRIVAKVDELMALCNELEAARTKRETKRDRLAAASLARLNTPDPETFRDDARFVLDVLPALTARPDQIKQLRQTILTLAVRGKLVSQDPADEPAAELLRRIANERLRRPTSSTLAALPPGDILPNGWTYANLQQIAVFENGDRSSNYPSGTDIVRTGIPFFSTKNLDNYKLQFDNLDYISEAKFSSLRSGKLKDRDILITLRGSVGKFGLFSATREITTGFINAQMLIIRSLLPEVVDFILTFMKSDVFLEQVRTRASGSATPQLSAGQLAQVAVYLPPLAEQHRIVAKVDELMALCDQLETSLTSAEDARKKLLDALLVEALAPVDAEVLQEAAE